MILQGESYEFGTVFQTDFVALLARCFVGSLLFGCCFLDVAFWLVAFWQYWQSTKQQNHKTTRQQKKTRIATFIFDGAFIAQE